MEIQIIGGVSSPSQISIFSNEFVATARWHTGGRISCDVKRRPLLAQFFYKHKYLPIPQLARIVLFLFSAITKKTSMLIGASLMLGCLVGIAIFRHIPANPVPVEQNPLISTACEWVFRIAPMIILAAYIKQNIAKWHGAEHMAISSYNKTGSAEMQNIVKESPINDECGTRLFMPLYVLTFVACYLAEYVGFSKIIFSLVTAECVLWIDRLRGWDKISGASHISRLLQKYVATKIPGERELRTAQRALRELISAHRSA